MIDHFVEDIDFDFLQSPDSLYLKSQLHMKLELIEEAC